MMRWVRWVVGGVLLGCVAAAVWGARGWPLVGDAALIHYVVFAMRHGVAPYRGVVDVNLPGTYFFEWLGVRVFGGGAGGWRAYDLALLVGFGAGCVVVARRLGGWFGGVLAGGMMALVHLQDGVFQVGQRDLLMAVLLVWAYAGLFAGEMFWFGVAMGAAATVKPVLLPLAVVLLGMQWRRGRVWLGVVGMALPGVAMVLWLAAWGSVGPFWGVVTGVLRVHAGMGKQGLGFLLGHGLAPVWGVVAVWAVVAWRGEWDWMRVRLAVGVGGAFFAYAVQGKGYPYQRYPLLAVMLLLVGVDFDRALWGRGWVRWVGLVGCVVCLGLGLRFAWVARGFSGDAPFQVALAERLRGEQSVQCMDTFGGCVGVLHGLGTLQATGYLYDCYLFGPESDERARYREGFWRAFEVARPRVVVVTDQFCFGGTDGFGKVARWPEMAGVLAGEYRLAEEWRAGGTQHWWSRRDVPTGFRVYRLRVD